MDQSNFDGHQSKGTILAVLRAIGDTLKRKMSHSHDIVLVWNAMMRGIETLGAMVHCGRYRFTWENGVPSGWRWTALIDTLLNIASFRIITRWLRESTGLPFVTNFFRAQGDDVIFTSTSVWEVQLIIHAYNIFGYEVHPHKTFISRHRAEFLRRSYERGEFKDMLCAL